MTKLRRASVVLLFPIALAAAALPAAAQDTPAAPPQAAPQPSPRPAAPPTGIVPVKVDVTLVKYQNGAKVSSLPYSLSLGANGPRSSLRIGAEVMVGGGGDARRQQIGTYIDCQAAELRDGRFSLTLSVNDTSAYATKPQELVAISDSPPVRSFVVTNQVLTLSDGGTGEFVTATDRLTGEMIKVEVKLTVVK